MGKIRMLMGLAVAMTASLCRAETLVNSDFSKGSTGWVLNNAAQLVTVGDRQVLSLTQNETSQAGIVWTELKRRVPSFSFIADLRIRFEPPDEGSCPADGMAVAFADAGPNAEGGAGGNLGLFGNPDDLGTFIALDINTWYAQGLGGGLNCHASRSISETVSFAVLKTNCDTCQRSPESGRTSYDRHTGVNSYEDPVKGGIKLGQTGFPEGMKLVNGGAYRFQWNVDGATNTMTCFVTGLEERNKQFQKVKVAEIKSGIPTLDFEGRWGITAATGGAVQHSEVLTARIDVPMIEPL